jgi:hypothetical protein
VAAATPALVDDTVEVPVVVADAAHEDQHADAGEDPDPSEDPAPGADADKDADPLFEELVAAHGADPVHDDLPPVTANAPDETPAPGGDDASSTPSAGG